MSKSLARKSEPVPTSSQVSLCGRLSGVLAMTLPSGDEAVSFRVIVDRPPRLRGPQGRVRVDAIDCVAWSATLRRRLMSLDEGELVTVTGCLQRRFWRSGSGSASRTEVLASQVRRAA